jgi:phosphoglycerate kinase
MSHEFLTLEEVETEGKRVFLRADINSSIDPSTKRIIDDSRIKAVAPTLKSLSKAKVVIGAHQSRPGEYDFTSLEPHTRVLQMYCDRPVRFVDDVIGAKALKAIDELKPGDVLVIDNLRLLKEENKQAPPEELAKTELVRTLAPHFDLVVNDAFAAVHRSQPSLVGFGEVLPMVAGRLMESELVALEKIVVTPRRPCIFVLGGAKVEDRMPVIHRVLAENIADKLLLGGVINNIFLMAGGYLSQRLEKESEEVRKQVDEARGYLKQYNDKIEMSIDVALDVNRDRVEVGVEKLTEQTNVYDIGLNTIAHFREIIKGAGTVVGEGPLGMFERRGFDIGTLEIVEALAHTKAFTLLGGGHLGSVAAMMNMEDKIGYISTGGGAFLSFLAGEKLPVVEALKRSKKRRKG